MRRFIALFLLCLVPLQLAWAGVQPLRGHFPGEAAVLGWHVHDGGDHDHDDASSGDDTVPGDSADEGAGGHYHPTLSLLIAFAAPLFATLNTASPPAAPPRAFASRTPPPADRPPAARG